MQRTCMKFLSDWLISHSRKPLVIRGARQVGKTWIVRNLAKIANKNLIEINFEKRPELASLFNSNNPEQILLNLSSAFEITNHKNSILFLDEIQAAPELFAKLRWFAEDMPELPVIAAGSLLEFVLEKHSFSMPVGRINYMYLEPLSFEEFLLANNKNNLVKYIQEFSLTQDIAQAIHEQLILLFKEYIIIGGMPAAVSNWVNKKSTREVNQIHHDLIATYRDDFAKYSGRLDSQRLDEIMMSVPLFLGHKFVYSKINRNIQSSTIKQSLELLFKAKICHKVSSTAANGLPLGAEINEKFFKAILLDVGLCSAILGLSIDQLNIVDNLDLINKGGIAEQVVGQILRTINPCYVEPSLFYWQRLEKGSSAEVDYLLQHKNNIIPIEVKAGSTGTLKSLHLFMNLKKLSKAVRVNSDIPSENNIKIKDHAGNNIEYKLLSLPFYLLSELQRLLD